MRNSDTVLHTMNDNTLPTFRRCPNCGTYYIPGGEAREVCSPACKVMYERCAVCGRFFPKKEGIGEGVCSTECAKVYTPVSGAKKIYVLTEETV